MFSLTLFDDAMNFYTTSSATFSFLFQIKPQIPRRGVIAKVCPTKNNGFAELVIVRETVLADQTEPILWFIFQKLKYVWDSEKSQFRSIEFPIHNTYAQ